MSASRGSLLITLRRSIAGTKLEKRKVLQALNLRKIDQVVQKPNNAGVRGMVNAVRHLVSVETDDMAAARRMRELKQKALRPPVVVQHLAAPVSK